MHEVEVKILNIDRSKVEKQLIAWGAEKIFDGEIISRFYDFKDNSVKNKNNLIRLRKAQDTVFLTYKTPIPDESVKIRKEYEIVVSDFDTTHEILLLLGLHVWNSMKKRRVSYVLHNVHFEFDTHHDQYSFVPEFLEIEATDSRTLYTYVEKLGFKKEECRPWTILDIVNNIYPEHSDLTRWEDYTVDTEI